MTNLSADDLLNTIEHSHKANELELAMSHVFNSLVADNELDNLNDMFNYGVAWNGSKNVVERFSKLHGLVVLRRDDGGLSDDIMRIILSEWVSLASERGLAFLQFVLDMLYPNQNEIVRLYHSKSLANEYPQHLFESAGKDRFLTSRIRVKLNTSIDVKELAELTPILSRLVPANIVPEISISFEIPPTELGVAVVAQTFTVADFTGWLEQLEQLITVEPS